jgi:tryptophan 2,3-dioxygenase
MVETFLDNDLLSIQTHHKEQIQNPITSSVAHEVEVHKRFDAQFQGAKKYINAEDIGEREQRPFVKRYRATLIYIESYRELPLLAWPRTRVDAVVEFEAEMGFDIDIPVQ